MKMNGDNVELTTHVRDLSVGVHQLVKAMEDRARTEKGYVDFAKIRLLQTDRPEGLDRLAGLIGDWEGPARAWVLGTDQIIEGHGTRQFKWGVERRYLIDTFQTEMQGGMGKMESMAVWTYDPSIGRYRSWWFHSWGIFGTGIVTYDAQSGEFVMEEGDERNTLDGKEYRIKWRTAAIDPNTIAWRANAALGERGYEISGTYKRV
jgi:hypothetical protein